MSQNQAFYALRDVLANLYPNEVDGRRVADEAGLAITRITFSAPMSASQPPMRWELNRG